MEDYMVSTRESLLSPSAVKLYGRTIEGLTVNVKDARAELGGNRFLREQLERPAGEPQPVLARIYGYSYLGRYRPLARPAIFLVHGMGEDASAAAVKLNVSKGNALNIEIIADNATLDPATTPYEKSGVAAKEWEFSTDIRVWEYDQGDFSLRLDVESGPLERILVEAEEGGTDRMPYFGNRIVRRRGPGE
jgi:hypothetical protein